MMPYIVGYDHGTGELTVIDIRTDTFILSGTKEYEEQIRDLVQAANERCHQLSRHNDLTPDQKQP